MYVILLISMSQYDDAVHTIVYTYHWILSCDRAVIEGRLRLAFIRV